MSRIPYYVSKLKRAYRDNTLPVKLKKKAWDAVYIPSLVLSRYTVLGKDRSLQVKEGFRDHRRDEDSVPVSLETAERLIRAYLRAKEDQPGAPDALQIKGLWSEWIDVNYGCLIEALNQRNAAKLVELLNNFDREDFAVGTGTSHLDWLHARHGPLRSAYVKTVWAQYRDITLSAGIDVSQVFHPKIGNPAGVMLNGSPFPTEAWRHVFNAFEFNHLLRDVQDSVVVEIGGGFGSQCYQTVRATPFSRYYVFDIPEVAVISAAFLITALPDKKVALYGENEEDAEIIVKPHFAIDELLDNSVDLFFNSNSFSEMAAESAEYYLEIINRSCRKYFKHINHEVRLTFADGQGKSVNRIGSEMEPNPGRFKRIFKRPRLFGRPEDKLYRSNSYLYERLATS